MKKLTLVLVALLLALTCVFVACGKKNETPVDNDPKPVDNTPAPVETPTVEDMTPVAEQFKKDLAANYVDLYSKEVENAIDAEKSAALLKIMGASTKEEAQKIADEFIAFLKAQKTSYDVLKDLVAEIGDVALADEDLVKEAAAYVAALDAEFAGSNAAKKAVLDAYKADKATKKAVTDAGKRLAQLALAKAIADVKKDDEIDDAALVAIFDLSPVDGKADFDGLNAQIAALNEKFADEDKKTFNLDDVNDYEALLDEVNKHAAKYEIEVGSDAYNEIFDVETLAAAKTILDAAVNADPVLVAMLAVIDANETLKAAAEEARYKEYIDVDKTALVAAADSTHTVAVKYEDATKYAAAKLADDAKEENVVTVEKVIDLDYKLSLIKDIEEAQKVAAVLDKYAKSKLDAYGYASSASEVVYAARKSIDDIEDAYDASVKRAEDLLKKDIYKTNYTNIDLEKDDTVAYYDGFATTAKNYTVATRDTAPKGTKLGDEIAKITKTFKTVNAAGYEVSVKAYKNEGDYSLKDINDDTYKFYLKDGKAAIAYTAYTYEWYLEKSGDLTAKTFDVLAALAGVNSGDGEYFTNWLVKYIGEGEYGDKIELDAYKDYGTGAFEKKVIYMTDRAVTEKANAVVVKINDVAVTVEASEALEAKVLSPYTIAKAMADEAKKIADAKKAALDEVAAAALALRTAGDANAIVAADKLYNGINDGTYLDEKFNGEDAGTYTALYADATNVAALEVVVKTKTGKELTDTTRKVKDLIADAKKALTAAEALVSFTTLSDAKVVAAENALKENKAFVEVYKKFIEKADKAVKIAKDANDITTSDDNRLAEGKKAVLEAAEEKAATVKALYNLLLSKDAFDAANDGDAVLKTTKDVKEICTILAPFSASGVATYASLDVADDDQKADKALYDYLAAILPAAGKAQDALQKAVADEEEALAKAYDEFKIALKASEVNTTNVDAAVKAINDFAKDYYADFINLTVSKTFGEKAVTVDFLTETFRQKTMAVAYGVVAKAVAYAATKGATLDGTAPDTWEKKAQAGVDANTFKLAAVESISAANEAIKDYEIVDDLYDLDEALRLINDKIDPDITMEKFKGELK